MTAGKLLKRRKIRHNEYYSTQEMFDDLYAKSNNGYVFKDLMTLITSEQNIVLAYRNIKKNKGRNTPGTNTTTIGDIAQSGNDEIVNYVRNRLQNFTPHSVRRKEIPKGDGSGKVRPLGIPTMEDRLIQQCILHGGNRSVKRNFILIVTGLDLIVEQNMRLPERTF
ncbi:hypothetical protein SMD22_00550 (plasmid) [Brevibacillus halotolerans]|nr:hypothetical protein SMD22_00550 [Brevibacillus halotolerans]